MQRKARGRFRSLSVPLRYKLLFNQDNLPSNLGNLLFNKDQDRGRVSRGRCRDRRDLRLGLSGRI